MGQSQTANGSSSNFAKDFVWFSLGPFGSFIGCDPLVHKLWHIMLHIGLVSLRVLGIESMDPFKQDACQIVYHLIKCVDCVHRDSSKQLQPVMVPEWLVVSCLVRLDFLCGFLYETCRNCEIFACTTLPSWLFGTYLAHLDKLQNSGNRIHIKYVLEKTV